MVIKFMKYSLFLILMMGMCHLSCSRYQHEQTSDDPDFRLRKLYYRNSDGERGVTTYYYNRSGDNYLAHWQLEDSSRSSVNVHEIDSSGNTVRIRRIFSDSVESMQYFEYDTAGHLVRQEFKRSDGGSGTTSYVYDENGILTMADCRGMNGWFHGQIHYRFEDGIKTGAILLRDSDTIGSIQYDYDGERLLHESWDFNGQWDQTFQYEYAKAADRTFTYSNVFLRESPWYRVTEEYYDFNGQTGGPSYYDYSDMNLLESKEYLRSDGMHTSTVYEYDTTGLLRYSHRAYPEGDTALFHHWYSINRRLLVRTWEHPDGSRGSETYRYDEHGNLSEGVYENVDGWLSGTLTFDHDEMGVLRYASFTGDEGTDAQLTFIYDLNFNLVRIHWIFGDGTTQTYSYKYGPANP